MKRTFYNLIILFVVGFGFNANQAYGQCTDFIAGPFIDLDMAFNGAPCDDGTGCPVNEFNAFEAFAAESYIVTNFVAGGEYAFSLCTGPSAGTWMPDFTIQAPSGAIDAFGVDADGCTISWTASETGDYIIIINEAGQCGGGSNTMTSNGFLTLTCNTGTACGTPPPTVTECNAGTLTSTGTVAICDPAETFDLTVVNDTIPDGGIPALIGLNTLGGTGGDPDGLFIIGVANTSDSYDSDLNGAASFFGWEPLSGPWIFFTGIANAAGTLCAISQDSLIVNFGTESPTITEITQSASGELTVNATGGVEPYSYLWDDPAGQTTQTAVGLDAGVVFTVIVEDAFGCITSAESEATVSTNSISSLNEHNIVPNPNNGSFSVQLNFDISEFVEVEVLDISGRVVQSSGKELTSGQFDFNLNNIAAGVYFVRITAGAESLTERIIVSK